MSAAQELLEPAIRPSPDTLSVLRRTDKERPGNRWAAYQVRERMHLGAGELHYLFVGPRCVFKEPPLYCPDVNAARRWPFRFIGWVNLATGEVEESDFPGNAV